MWPNRSVTVGNLLRPFENNLDGFLNRPLEDRKFILKKVFSWLDLLFVPDRSIMTYQSLADGLSHNDILRLEGRIMKFVAQAIVGQDYHTVSKPSATDWFCYALIRGHEYIFL